MYFPFFKPQTGAKDPLPSRRRFIQSFLSLTFFFASRKTAQSGGQQILMVFSFWGKPVITRFFGKETEHSRPAPDG